MEEAKGDFFTVALCVGDRVMFSANQREALAHTDGENIAGSVLRRAVGSQ